MRAVSLALVIAACGGGNGAVPRHAPGTGTGTSTGTGTGSAATAAAAPKVHAQGHPAATLTPRVAFFQNPTNSGARLSPDGKQIVWLAPRNNVPLPLLAPLDNLKAAAPVAADTTRPVTGVYWTADGKHLLYQQDPTGDGNQHVFRYDVADGKAVDLVPIKGARVDLLGLGPRKPNVVIVGMNDRDSQWDDIYSVDLKTGDKKRIVVNTESIAQFILDDDLVPRFGTKQTAEGGGEFVTITAKGTFEHWDAYSPDEASSTRLLGIDPTGKIVWMLDARLRDTAAVFAVDIKTKKKKLLAEDPHVDAISGFVNPVTLDLAAVGFNDLRGTWKFLEPAIAKDAAVLDKIAGGVWEIASATADGKQWLVQYSSDIQPAAYYLYDRKTKGVKLVMSSTPELDSMALSAMTSFEVAARDGQRLVAFATVPREHDPSRSGVPDHPLPAVLMVGADPTQRLVWTYNPIHQWLASRGYVVITTNTRGAIGFGKAFTAAGARQWGRAMQDDLDDVVKALVAKNIVDPAKVCIVGMSYGGYAALMGLARSGTPYACAIDVLGPTDLEAAARLLPPQLAPVFAARIGDPTTPAGLAALREVSPQALVDKITRPLLVVQSADRTTAELVTKLVDALVKRKAPVTYLTFADEPADSIDKPANSYAMLGVIEAYLSEQLGGPFEPLAPDALAATSMTAAVGGERVPGL